MTTADAVAHQLANHQLTRSIQMLMGIVTGIVSDGALHDMELQMLRTWLSENQRVSEVWPGSAIARQIDEVLADGVITPEERAHLLDNLQRFVGNDFANTGSVTPEVATLPFDDEAEVDVRMRGVCLTGEFVYGTRAKCERLTEKVGGITLPGVSKKTSYLVVGTHVSPAWVNTSYGRKIMQAMELKLSGHGIAIIREERWLKSLTG